jgi:methyl-accepting chemotaxis protein
VAKVRQVDELITEVASASREQSQGIAQVTIAVTQMDRITQSNAAIAEESAGASEQLRTQAQALRQQVHALLSLVKNT